MTLESRSLWPACGPAWEGVRFSSGFAFGLHLAHLRCCGSAVEPALAGEAEGYRGRHRAFVPSVVDFGTFRHLVGTQREQGIIRSTMVHESGRVWRRPLNTAVGAAAETHE
jgi:hypothetical protein